MDKMDKSLLSRPRTKPLPYKGEGVFCPKRVLGVMSEVGTKIETNPKPFITSD